MNLLNFLQQSIGGAKPEEDEELARQRYEEEGGVVNGGNIQRPEAQLPTYNEPPERPAVDPQYVLNDDRIAPRREEMQEILPREGKFGVKGTLRDILGIVSDGFLVQSGNKAVYQPRREQEQMADAAFGFTQNPQQAIERLNAAGFQKEAASLQEQIADQDYKKGALQSQVSDRQSRADDRNFDNRDKGFNRIARWTAGGVPYDKLVTAAQQYGIGEEELQAMGITPDMTPEDRRQVGTMDMTMNQQMQIPFTERRVGVAERNAASGESRAQSARIQANKPRAGSRPRADTELEYYRELSGVPEARRSPEQKAFMNKYIKGTKGGAGSRAAGIPPPPGQKKTQSRFRVIQ